MSFSAISGVKQRSSSNHSLQAECRRTWKTYLISHWDFSVLRFAEVLTVLLAHHRFKDCGEFLKWFCMLRYVLISDCSLCHSSLNVPKGLSFDLLCWCLTELGWGKLQLNTWKNSVRHQWGYNRQSCAEVISTFLRRFILTFSDFWERSNSFPITSKMYSIYEFNALNFPTTLQ